MAGYVSPPTDVRYKRPIDGDTFQELVRQLNAGERLAILADARHNRTGYSAHVCPIIETQEEFDSWMLKWTDEGYYIIHPYAV